MASFARTPGGWRMAAALLVIVAVLSLAGPALAAETRPQGTGPAPSTPTGVVINLPAKTLYWYVDGELVRVFPVAVGKPTTASPKGSYKVQSKAVHPWWQPPNGGAVVPPGPANPLGTRWIQFNGGYGIHGNNNPASIGGTVSLGCIRMYKEDVEWLYDQVKIGTPVTLLYETVQIQYGPAGQKYLAIYPNVYGHGKQPTAAQVLAQAGYDPETVDTDGPGLYLLDAAALVNGQPLPATLQKGRPYLAARELGRRLSAEVLWDEAAQAVLVDGQAVSKVLRGGTGYVDAEEVAAVLGVEYRYNAETGTAVLSGRPLFLNGHLLNRQGQVLDDGAVYLPVRSVAEASGAAVGWDNTARKATVNGDVIDSLLRHTRAFAKSAVLAAHLHLNLRIEGDSIFLDK
jgi:L,D-transpeptidase ErfK/SrfK